MQDRPRCPRCKRPGNKCRTDDLLPPRLTANQQQANSHLIRLLWALGADLSLPERFPGSLLLQGKGLQAPKASGNTSKCGCVWKSSTGKIWICQEVGEALLNKWCWSCGQKDAQSGTHREEKSIQGSRAPTRSLWQKKACWSRGHLRTLGRWQGQQAEWVFPHFSFPFPNEEIISSIWHRLGTPSWRHLQRQDETGKKEVLDKSQAGHGGGETRAPVICATQTSEGGLSGRVGDLTLKKAVIWENSSAACPGKLWKALLQCSSTPALPGRST